MNLYWLETFTERILLSCSRFDLADYCRQRNATVAHQLGLSDPNCPRGVVLRIPYPLPEGVEVDFWLQGNLARGGPKWEAAPKETRKPMP